MPQTTRLSSWWNYALAVTMIFGFSVLVLLTVMSYDNIPPIPKQAIDPNGTVVFTANDVQEGQAIFLKHGLMNNGTVWGHGAYMGPDFSAAYLHAMAEDTAETVAKARYSTPYGELPPADRESVNALVTAKLKANDYDAETSTLTLTEGSYETFKKQIHYWREYFVHPTYNGGLYPKALQNAEELRKLTAFFAWTAWVSTAQRPGYTASYTNNFPYEPMVGNKLTTTAILSSAASVVGLLAFLALALLCFGRFDYLGWRQNEEPPAMAAEAFTATPAQRATLKYMAFAALLFLFQVLMGAALAHYRADPGSFYGFDLSPYFPSNLLRTWHLQSAIFWIATSYVAGALFIAQMFGKSQPAFQRIATHILFVAFGIVIVGSLLGEWAGIAQLFPKAWFWIGNQGWEYLELGRFWQILMAVGLLFWFGLIWRALIPAFKDPEKSVLAKFFLAASLAIPVFYIPAFFFTSHTHMTIVDTWRFWIIHLWVEGFFEFFLTVLVAVVFVQIGLVQRMSALRLIYLDAILYFGSGIIGTGHHWYWTGQTELNMALSAIFSALEVVPLTLLTLDAWDFVQVTQVGKTRPFYHKWTFYFLMAVGGWNFVGAGLFGFLINMPIVSYYEVGTMLTPNHGHAAMMGVFGMLGCAMMVFVLQNTAPTHLWPRLEKLVRLSFWGLNVGLALMLALSLLPGGIWQIIDVIENGYWHARDLAFTSGPTARLFEWLRMPGDLIFIFAGALPLALAVVWGYWASLREKAKAV